MLIQRAEYVDNFCAVDKNPFSYYFINSTMHIKNTCFLVR
jgi:hypothetical protein